MKKLLALLLALTMLLTFAACGDKEDKKSNKGEETPKIQIDLEAEGEQVVSEDRAAKATLVETKDVWLEGKMTFALATDAKLLAVFWETGDGWTLYSIGSTNLQ